MTTSSLSNIITANDTVSVGASIKEPSSNKKTFNFNPQEIEVSSFLSHVLLGTLGTEKLAELRAKQEIMDSLLKKIDGAGPDEKEQLENKVAGLKSELILAATEKVIEKIKFTFTGFDISKQSIPSALINGSENILDARILSLLSKGYLTHQIYSVFKTTDNKFGNLSEKSSKNRTSTEERKYNKLLTLLAEVIKIEKLSKNPNTTNEELTTVLEQIKTMGKKAAKMYGLLSPLAAVPLEKATDVEKNHLVGTIRNFITLFREVLEEILSPVHNLMTGTTSVSFVEASSPPPREIYRSIPEPSFINNSASFFRKAPERGTLLDEKTENNLQSANQTEAKASERYFSIRL